MDFDELIELRRSVRNYAAAPEINEEQISTLIQAAQQAPSWKNSQTGRYYAACTPDKIKEIQACLIPHNQNVSKDAGALIITTFVKDIAGFSDKTPDNELGNGWGSYDLGLQNAYLILKAADMGVDTLIMGLRDADALRRLINIPENETIVSVIAVGHRNKQDIPKPPRKPVSEILRIY